MKTKTTKLIKVSNIELEATHGSGEKICEEISKMLIKTKGLPIDFYEDLDKHISNVCKAADWIGVPEDLIVTAVDYDGGSLAEQVKAELDFYDYSIGYGDPEVSDFLENFSHRLNDAERTLAAPILAEWASRISDSGWQKSVSPKMAKWSDIESLM